MLEGKKIAVFDAEIKNPIESLSNGWKSYDEMGVSCLVAFDYQTMRYRVFDDHNISDCIDILTNHDFVVGFNTVGFDWKLLQATYPMGSAPRKSQDFDILREIWISIGVDPDRFQPSSHGGYKLDDVAFETIGLRKSGDGAHAPILYQQGKIAELIDYCVQDVRIEKELFEFIVKFGYVLRNGRKIKIQFTK
jgi:DEAD/DEAH box helicase domain-containing protein